MLQKFKNKVNRGAISLLRNFPGAVGDYMRVASYTFNHLSPEPPDVADMQQWIPASQVGLNGIDIREPEQLEQLDRWKSERYQNLFAKLRNNPVINTQRLGQKSLTNGWYNTPDAEIYAAMILDRQPRRIIEVGAGFSTRIARAAVDHGGLPTRITVVDPAPRTEIREIAHEVITAPVERSRLDERDWAAGDLLFVDSSHICRTRGDIPFLFCKLIPRLPEGVLVHVHDIYLPFDYPNNLDRRCYTEQYILHALLSQSPRYKTVITSHWLSRMHPERMREAFGNEVAQDVRLYGGCYWFEVV